MRLSVERIIILLLLLALGFGFWKLRQISFQNASYQRLGQSQGWEIVEWRNKFNNSQARIKTLQSGQEALEAFYQDWVDSLSHQMDIAPQRMQSITSVGLVTQQHVRFVADPTRRDTVYQADTLMVIANGFSHADAWSQITARFLGDSIHLHYRFNDSLSVVSHLKRDQGFGGWALGKKTLYTDVVSHNPYSTITNVRSWQKAVPVRRFGLGPYVGWDPLQGPSVGVSLHYSVIQF